MNCEMAEQQDDSFVEDFKHSEFGCIHSPHKVLKFNESFFQNGNCFHDNIVKSSQPMVQKPQAASTVCGTFVKSAQMSMDKLSESALEKPSSDSVTVSDVISSCTSQYWHSTPSTHDCKNTLPRLRRLVMTRSSSCSELSTHIATESVVTINQCCIQPIASHRKPVNCEVAAFTNADGNATTAADGELPSSAVSSDYENRDLNAEARTDIGPTAAAVAAHEEKVSHCNAVHGEVMATVDEDADQNAAAEHEMTSDAVLSNSESAEIRELNSEACISTEPSATALATCENKVCSSGDIDHVCRLSESDTNGGCCRNPTTESVCRELTEMMQQRCVIDVDQLPNSSASDADLTDSFDLEVAAQDLQEAISAGMLDFLLESYEDSTEDIGLEEVCEELDEWPLSDDDDDDDDDDADGDWSESTLTDSSMDSSNDSVVVVVDIENSYDVDDECGTGRSDKDVSSTCDNGGDDYDVELRSREILWSRRKNGFAKSRDEPNGGLSAADADCLQDDDDDVERRHERVKNRLKENSDDVRDNGASTVAVNCTGDSDDDDEDVLTRHERIKRCLKKTLHDDDGGGGGDGDIYDDDSAGAVHINMGCRDENLEENCSENINVSQEDKNAISVTQDVVTECSQSSKMANGIYSRNDDGGDCSIDGAGDDGLMRRQRVKRLMQIALPAADYFNSCSSQDADLSGAIINGLGSGDKSLYDGTCFANTEAAYGFGEQDIVVINGEDDAYLDIAEDQFAGCVPYDCLQSARCTNAINWSHVCDSTDDGLVKADVGTSRESAVNNRIPCSDHPPCSQNMDHEVDNVELSLGEVAAGCTSTPSPSSQHSQTHCAAINWRQGIYNGLCRHNDGSDIRM